MQCKFLKMEKQIGLLALKENLVNHLEKERKFYYLEEFIFQRMTVHNIWFLPFLKT